MLTLQVMDTIFYEVQRQGRISFYVTSIGEEAINVASAAALSMDDFIFPQVYWLTHQKLFTIIFYKVSLTNSLQLLFPACLKLVDQFDSIYFCSVSDRRNNTPVVFVKKNIKCLYYDQSKRSFLPTLINILIPLSIYPCSSTVNELS